LLVQPPEAWRFRPQVQPLARLWVRRLQALALSLERLQVLVRLLLQGWSLTR
jgi:hypothetical protein